MGYSINLHGVPFLRIPQSGAKPRPPERALSKVRSFWVRAFGVSWFRLY